MNDQETTQTTTSIDDLKHSPRTAIFPPKKQKKHFLKKKKALFEEKKALFVGLSIIYSGLKSSLVSVTFP